IFRDPRWGRGQETYGEDPFLTATMGKAFVRGLQGDDPKYLKAAACAKHFAVHSGPEPSRHAFDVSPTDYDLWNTYLPAFKELVVNAHVAGVMCAYNAFRGQPCCGSDPLMVDILRNQWKFTQTSESVLESPEHKAHTLKMARQSIVLLKNDNHTQPLSKKIKKIIVVGPNADKPIAVLGNYNGTPSEIVTALQGIRNKLGN